MRNLELKKKNRLQLDPMIAVRFKELMIVEIEKKIEAGELTEYKVIEDVPVSPRPVDIPAVIAINKNNGLTALQSKVFTELKEVEREILKQLNISEEDYDRSLGGIKIAFGRTQMERRGLIQ